MVHTSKSGLLPASRKFIKNTQKKVTPRLEFQSCIRPVKFTLKPYSEIINPYRHGCSILCNHPTSNTELPRAIKKTTRPKDEPEDCGVDKKVLVDRVGEVLEDMLLSRYRREEEEQGDIVTDGEEASPIETPEENIVAEPVAASTVGGQRTVLVLDLRRTASQETIATREGRETCGDARSPIISPTQSSVSAASQSLTYPARGAATAPPSQEPHLEPAEAANEAATATSDEVAPDESDVQRRRGKVRKKKKSGKNISVLPDDRGSKEVVGLIEPGETQVSACKESGVEDYRSGQTSATPAEVMSQGGAVDCQEAERLLPVSDLFDHATLRHLRRTVTVHDAEAHFRSVWRKVLEEAIIVSEISPEEEMKHVVDKVNIEPSAPENWIAYPRGFAYDRTRFDLPINKDKLNCMTPLEYLRDYVAITKRHNLLYDHVFDKYREYVEKNETVDEETKIELVEDLQNLHQQQLLVEKKEENLEQKEEEKVGERRAQCEDKVVEGAEREEVAEQEAELNQLAALHILQEEMKPSGKSHERERFMLGQNILPALGEIMSRPFNEEETSKMKEMVNWADDDVIELRTWVGLCALAERVFGQQFSAGQDTNLGRPQVIERVDFENLLEKLPRLQLRPDLLALLTAVREACERLDDCELEDDIYGLSEAPPSPPEGGAEVQELRRVPRIGILDDDDSDAEYFNSEHAEEPEQHSEEPEQHSEEHVDQHEEQVVGHDEDVIEQSENVVEIN